MKASRLPATTKRPATAPTAATTTTTAPARTRSVDVWGDWAELPARRRIGALVAQSVRGKEVFSFEYDPAWLHDGSALVLDPSLQLGRGRIFPGRQGAASESQNFGVFLDSSPDRWGRVLMNRREAFNARKEGRPVRPLYAVDYLLGVNDPQRMGGLRFRIGEGPFLDDNEQRAAPPLTSLRALEQASLQLERRGEEDSPSSEEALRLLLVPGSSLGGARPKASVTNVDGSLWLAKFPSADDLHDVGAWEEVAARLARKAGIHMAESRAEQFTHRHHTFLTQRFDRLGDTRVHFASAMTLTGHVDGEPGSYLEIADVLVQHGANPAADLEQLWRRIVFAMCISHVDDHLRNHGFLHRDGAWRLAPAYDVNPIPTGNGHVLNIDDSSNAQDLSLARDVAPVFRVNGKTSESIIAAVRAAVRTWRDEARALGIGRDEQDRLANAFRLAA